MSRTHAVTKRKMDSEEVEVEKDKHKQNICKKQKQEVKGDKIKKSTTKRVESMMSCSSSTSTSSFSSSSSSLSDLLSQSISDGSLRSLLTSNIDLSTALETTLQQASCDRSTIKAKQYQTENQELKQLIQTARMTFKASSEYSHPRFYMCHFELGPRRVSVDSTHVLFSIRLTEDNDSYTADYDTQSVDLYYATLRDWQRLHTRFLLTEKTSLHELANYLYQQQDNDIIYVLDRSFTIPDA